MTTVSEKLTPAMKQFHQFKQKYPDCVLFFRMGDFYETFYDDAKICSKVLGLTLTSRSKGDKLPLNLAQKARTLRERILCAEGASLTVLNKLKAEVESYKATLGDRIYTVAGLSQVLSLDLTLEEVKATFEQKQACTFDIVVDDLKDLGFRFATTAGITISMTDMDIPRAHREQIIAKTEDDVQKTNQDFARGLISAGDLKPLVDVPGHQPPVPILAHPAHLADRILALVRGDPDSSTTCGDQFLQAFV